MEDNSPQATRKIRVTRSEAYAMRMAAPRKKRVPITLAGLLILVVLGSVLWLFRDVWLPYWLPEAEKPPPVAAESVETQVPPAAASPAASAAPSGPAPSIESGKLDYLSAAVWDNPRFLQGVRLFNRSLDQVRQYRRDRTPPALLEQAELGVRQAIELFDGLRAEAPATVPIRDYMARCNRLVAEIRRLHQPEAAAAARKPDLTAEELHLLPAYKESARAFNKALEQYNRYVADQTRKDLLKPTEDLARQAAGKFEALKRQVPESLHGEIDRQIHQCYGIVSACRSEQLKSKASSGAPGFKRGTTGPSRRPALPAYQSIP